MYILVGLGNPGKKYAHTRHNAGKMLAAFLRRHPVEGLEVMETDCYMNRSGEWIHKLYKNYKDYRSYENLIVAHDDLDLRLEEWKIHFGRGPRLHKGILSIEQALETKDFWRVRIGIEGRRPKAEGRRIVDRKWFRFGYDYSRLQDEPGVVLKVKFRLKKADSEKLKTRSLELLKARNIRQPVGQSSCGCMFKNPAGFSAGELIDQAGMKGKKVGGAVISNKHANFMINTGGAKATEVLKLMELTKEAVKIKSGIELTPEIFMVGEF